MQIQTRFQISVPYIATGGRYKLIKCKSTEFVQQNHNDAAVFLNH